MDTEIRDAGNGEVVGIEGDEFRVVVDAGGGDDEAERAGVASGCPALLAKAGGITPKMSGSRKERQGFKLGFDPFFSCGVAWRSTSKTMGSQRQARGSRIQGWIKVLKAIRKQPAYSRAFLGNSGDFTNLYEPCCHAFYQADARTPPGLRKHGAAEFLLPT